MHESRIAELDDRQLDLVAGGVAYASLGALFRPWSVPTTEGAGPMAMASVDAMQQRWADAVAQQQAAMQQMAGAAQSTADNAA